jgi:hypothetical protein
LSVLKGLLVLEDTGPYSCNSARGCLFSRFNRASSTGISS